MQTNGIHHITAVSAQIGRNADFYTRVLGLRLVKKSVNQDDTSAYHLFYADKTGSPGTDMTFFDWASAPRERRGSDSFAATAFRVPSPDALDWWQARLDAEGLQRGEIESFAGRTVLRFDDPEGQRLMLVDDGGAAYDGDFWEKGGVPETSTQNSALSPVHSHRSVNSPATVLPLTIRACWHVLTQPY